MRDGSDRSKLYHLVVSGPASSALQRLDRNMWSPQTIELCWREFVYHGKASYVKALMPLVNPRSDNDWALQEACAMGHAGVVRALLDVQCNPLSNNMTSLWNAMRYGHLKCLNMIFPQCQPHLPKMSFDVCAHYMSDAPWHTASVVAQAMDETKKHLILGQMIKIHIYRQQAHNNIEKLAATINLDDAQRTLMEQGEPAGLIEVVAALKAQQQHQHMSDALSQVGGVTTNTRRKI